MAHCWSGAKHSLKEDTTTLDGLLAIWTSSIHLADAIPWAGSLKITLAMCLVEEKIANAVLLACLLWQIGLQEQKLLSIQTSQLTSVWEGGQEQEGKEAQSTPKKSIFLFSSLQQLLWEELWNSNLPLRIPVMLQHQSICSWRPDLAMFYSPEELQVWITRQWRVYLCGRLWRMVHPRLGRRKHFTEDYIPITPSCLEPCFLYLSLSLPHWSLNLS